MDICNKVYKDIVGDNKMIVHDGKEIEIVNILFGTIDYAEFYYKHNNAYNFASADSLKGEELKRVINTFREKEKLKSGYYDFYHGD